ncbi:MAG: hypothetical protein NE334_10540 [Lentisphaeraceae bacterium]|nr:hypothetical protein [Lentisphaeraceae bacterium]
MIYKLLLLSLAIFGAWAWQDYQYFQKKSTKRQAYQSVIKGQEFFKDGRQWSFEAYGYYGLTADEKKQKLEEEKKAKEVKPELDKLQLLGTIFSPRGNWASFAVVGARSKRLKVGDEHDGHKVLAIFMNKVKIENTVTNETYELELFKVNK